MPQERTYGHHVFMGYMFQRRFCIAVLGEKSRGSRDQLLPQCDLFALSKPDFKAHANTPTEVFSFALPRPG